MIPFQGRMGRYPVWPFGRWNHTRSQPHPQPLAGWQLTYFSGVQTSWSTGAGTGMNPIGSYGSPTFMKNTVESLLCKQAQQEWQQRHNAAHCNLSHSLALLLWKTQLWICMCEGALQTQLRTKNQHVCCCLCGLSITLSNSTFITWNSSNVAIATVGHQLWHLFIMNSAP